MTVPESARFQEVRRECLYDRCTIIGKYLHLWEWCFFWKSHNKDLSLDDLLQCPSEDLSHKLTDELEQHWNNEVKNARKKQRRASLTRCIYEMFKWRALVNCLILILSQIVLMFQAVYMGSLVRNVNVLQVNPDSKSDLWLDAFMMVVCFFIYVQANNIYNVNSLHYTLKLRIAISGLMYRKALKLSKHAFLTTSTGAIVNMLSNDMNRIELILHFLPWPPTSIINTTLGIIFLWPYLGHTVLFGILVLLIVNVVQIFISVFYIKFSAEGAAITDQRIRLLNEFIPSIKTIKLYVWEAYFVKLINKTRKLEIFKISLGQYLYALSLGLFFVALKIVTYTCLISFVLLGNALNGEIVFLSLAILNKISFLSLYNAHFMRHIINGLVSSNRITEFLLLPESNSEVPEKTIGSGTAKIQIRNLFATYQSIDHSKSDKNDLTITLNNINFECKSGELVTVIAPVGGGKSSILHAILNEMNTLRGSVEVDGRISYASQEPVLFAGTLRENILFGASYDEQRYNEVVRVCALQRDFALLPEGDGTRVDNTQSVALSGGQKARLNLARAVYRQASIYLLDDPISAVDSHTSKHIFREAIQGFLSEKIVIFATHQLQFLGSSTKILLLNNGQQVAFGDYRMLEDSLRKMEFAKHSMDSGAKEKEEEENHIDSSIDALLEKSGNKSTEKIKKRQVIKEVTTVEFSSKAYYVYLKLGLSGWLGPMLVVTLITAQFVFSFSDYFLSLWTTAEEQQSNENGTISTSSFVDRLNRSQRIWIYNGLMIALLFLGLGRSYLFFKACMRSSVKLHKRLFRSVVRSPISFFETNPIGVLLNRVSRDCGIVDDILPVRFFDAVDIAVIDIGIAILMVLLEPYLILPLGLLFVGVLLLRMLYVRTAKFVKMLEGVTKSPVVSLLASTINSLSTIRAFKAQARFKDIFDRYQNDHASAFFLYSSGMTWFVHSIENLEVLLIAAILVIIIQLSQLTGSSVGLIVSSLVLFCHEFQWNIKNWCDVETYLTSVSRLDQYSKLKAEAALESAPDKKPPVDWPRIGCSIEFRNVSMKYFEDEPPVLRNLNFKVSGSEKIGIIGRTGAGKSSILNILFRLNEYEGEIIIDGVNIGEIGLHDLRSKISIIPQEPVLFTGTVRSNLDPLNQYEDYELWSALKAVQLEQLVKESEAGLESSVIDGGSNFSSGQKQLICLARAILRNSKILVLDEATANTDPATDELIQATIRSVFRTCTILTIAHRLNTVLDADRILVMDQGELREFDTPYRLLQDSNSLLSRMVDAYGEEQSKKLREMVKK